MTHKILSKLPSFLEGLLPVSISTVGKLKSEFNELDFHRHTFCTTTPMTQGALVALQYVDGEFTKGFLLSNNGSASSEDHFHTLKVVPKLPENYDLEYLLGRSMDHWPIYVLAQINCNSKHSSLIREKLPKIKTLKELGEYYLRSPSINPKLANYLELTAIDIFGVLDEKHFVRFNIPSNLLEQHLTSLGFHAYNTHRGQNSVTEPAIELLRFSKNGFFTKGIEQAQKMNSNYKINRLRIVSHLASESNYRTLVWKESN